MATFILKFIYRVIIFYGFIVTYTLNYGITSRYLSLAAAFFIIFLKRKKLHKVLSCIKWRRIKVGFGLIMACTFILLMSQALLPASFSANNAVISWWHFPYQFLYIFAFSIFCVVEFDSFAEFAKTWILFIIIESILIYMAVINDSVRLFFYAVSYVGDGRFDATIEYGSRIIGLGIYASDGSLTMSTGIIALIVLKLQDRINNMLFLAFSIIIVTATMFIGRTGVLAEILFLCYYFAASRKIGFSVFGGVLGILAVSFFISFFMQQLRSDVADRLQGWMMEAFNEESRTGTLNVATGTGFQDNNHTLFGNAGLLRGSFEGKRFQSDSGYIKMFTAIGIVGSFCYYLGMLNIFISVKRNKKKALNIFFVFLIVFVFVIEYKEPYLTKLRIPWFVFTTLLINAFDERYNIKVESHDKINKSSILLRS